jgi:hypothetical protein
MGLFWDYFKNSLRLSFIQKAGPLSLLAEGSAETLDDARGVILQLREQFLPEKCEAELLARYARSRGIVQAPLEPEAHYWGRVRFAYLWWSRGGRAGSMAATLIEYFGFAEVAVVNLRSEDPSRWAEFKVVAEIVGTDLMFPLEQVEWGINEMKRAGSKLAAVEFVYSLLSDVPVYSFGLTSAEIITVFPEPE